MKGFVVSWFYPPSTSAEGIVTYKLLKNSSYDFDVFCSSSNQWSYNCASELTAENTNVISVKTDDFVVWIEKALEHFEKNRDKYSFIMTRSMPPESQIIGLKIKEKYPDIPWIASFADPIGKNPYELLGFLQGKYGDKYIKYSQRPRLWVPLLSLLPGNKNERHLNKLLKLEAKVFAKADKIIFPSEEQATFTLGKKFKKHAHKVMIVPHSYDPSLYPKPEKSESDAFTFVYTGHSDNLRNPEGFIYAMRIIRNINPELFAKMKIRIIGNVPQYIKDKIYCFYLHHNILVEKPKDYQACLKVIQEADCLLHVDAFFPFLTTHFFFASKIADYIGTGKPVIAATPENSAAANVLKNTNAKYCYSWDHLTLAKYMCEMYFNRQKIENKRDEAYSVRVVAKNFDEDVKALLSDDKGDKS